MTVKDLEVRLASKEDEILDRLGYREYEVKIGDTLLTVLPKITQKNITSYSDEQLRGFADRLSGRGNPISIFKLEISREVSESLIRSFEYWTLTRSDYIAECLPVDIVVNDSRYIVTLAVIKQDLEASLWSPATSLIKPSIWASTRETDSLIVENNLVTRWNSLYGDGYFSSNAGLNKEAINGFDTIKTNGTNQYLVSDKNYCTGSFTIFVVGKGNVVNKNIGTWSFIGSIDGMQVVIDSNLKNVVTNPVENYNIAAYRLSLGNSLIGYLNGEITDSETVGSSLRAPNSQLFIGRYFGTNDYTVSEPGEIIVYESALSEELIDKNFGYLNYRWNLGLLDEDHPYFTNPPKN
jgi:hypothetical protein